MLLFQLLAVSEQVTPVTQGLTLGGIAAFVTLMTIVLNNRSKRQTAAALQAQHDADAVERHAQKLEDQAAAIAKETRDYARQDAVQAKQDQRALQTIDKLNDVEKLGKVTHALVNSDKTAGLKAQRDNWKVTLALMNEIMTLRKTNGTPPTIETIEAIQALTTQIATLETTIADRLRQQELAESNNESAPDQAQTGIHTERVTSLPGVPAAT